MRTLIDGFFMEISRAGSFNHFNAGSIYRAEQGSADEADLKKAVIDGEAVQLHLSDEAQKALGKEDDAKSAEDKAHTEKLKSRDLEVKSHEHAHMGAAGALAKGGASYTYQTGEDGQQYAVGGEVSIDLSKGKTPEETISRMQTVIAAAMAPANPSAQDRAVASQANQIMMDAQKELADENKVKESEGSQSKKEGERDEEKSRSHDKAGVGLYQREGTAKSLGNIVNTVA